MDGRRGLRSDQDERRLSRQRGAAQCPSQPVRGPGWKEDSNARAQRDLSISLEKIGDIKLRAGDAAEALAAYEESL
jgi:hypothetical protein